MTQRPTTHPPGLPTSGGPLPPLPLPPPPPGGVMAALPDMPEVAVFDTGAPGEDAEGDGIEQTKKVSKFVQLTPNFGFQIQRKPYNAILYEREMATEDIRVVGSQEVSTKKGEWTKWKRRGFYPNIIWMCSTVLKEQVYHNINNGPDSMNIQALMLMLINIDIGMRDAIMDMIEGVLLAVVEDREVMPSVAGRPPGYGTTEYAVLKKHDLVTRLKGAWARRLQVPPEMAEGLTVVKE